MSGFSFGCTKLQEHQMSLAQFGRGTRGVHRGLHATSFFTYMVGEKSTEK